eukprot:TRINITY_DN10658_c0_g1_i2.p1 TRINITY_DN10658_c0_g1~~TRINITY_DN10658_c0_g1_i2.p1  ORF type:complete len:1139 (+),score=206.26 TRINITY_DN10658_c0_g1_i2:274-3417(+)
MEDAVQQVLRSALMSLTEDGLQLAKTILPFKQNQSDDHQDERQDRSALSRLTRSLLSQSLFSPSKQKTPKSRSDDNGEEDDAHQLLPPAQASQAVVDAARELAASAVSLDDSAIKDAERVLKLVPDNQPEVFKFKQLIQGMRLLQHYGYKAIPMRVIASQDRLSFVEDALVQGKLSYRSPQQAFQIAANLTHDDFDSIELQLKLAQVAHTSSDHLAAYELLGPLMDKDNARAEPLAHRVATALAAISPKQAIDLHTYALKHCSVDDIPSRLSALNSCAVSLLDENREPQASMLSKLQQTARQALHTLASSQRDERIIHKPTPAPMTSNQEACALASELFNTDRAAALALLLDLSPDKDIDMVVLGLASSNVAADFATAYIHNRQGEVLADLKEWVQAQEVQQQHLESAERLIPGQNWQTMSAIRFEASLPQLISQHWGQLQPVLDLSSHYVEEQQFDRYLMEEFFRRLAERGALEAEEDEVAIGMLHQRSYNTLQDTAAAQFSQASDWLNFYSTFEDLDPKAPSHCKLIERLMELDQPVPFYHSVVTNRHAVLQLIVAIEAKHGCDLALELLPLINSVVAEPVLDEEIRGALVLERYDSLPQPLDDAGKLANNWLRKWEECLRLLKPCPATIYKQLFEQTIKADLSHFCLEAKRHIVESMLQDLRQHHKDSTFRTMTEELGHIAAQLKKASKDEVLECLPASRVKQYQALLSPDDVLQLMTDMVFALELDELSSRLLFKEYRDQDGSMTRVQLGIRLLSHWLQGKAIDDSCASDYIKQIRMVLPTDEQQHAAVVAILPELVSNIRLPTCRAITTELLNTLGGVLGVEARTSLTVLSLFPEAYIQQLAAASDQQPWLHATSTTEAYILLPTINALGMVQFLQTLARSDKTFSTSKAWAHLLRQHADDSFVSTACILADEQDVLNRADQEGDIIHRLRMDKDVGNIPANEQSCGFVAAVVMHRGDLIKHLRGNWRQNLLVGLRQLFNVSCTDEKLLFCRRQLVMDLPSLVAMLQEADHALEASILQVYCNGHADTMRVLNSAIAYMYTR